MTTNKVWQLNDQSNAPGLPVDQILRIFAFFSPITHAPIRYTCGHVYVCVPYKLDTYIHIHTKAVISPQSGCSWLNTYTIHFYYIFDKLNQLAQYSSTP